MRVGFLFLFFYLFIYFFRLATGATGRSVGRTRPQWVTGAFPRLPAVDCVSRRPAGRHQRDAPCEETPPPPPPPPPNLVGLPTCSIPTELNQTFELRPRGGRPLAWKFNRECLSLCLSLSLENDAGLPARRRPLRPGNKDRQPVRLFTRLGFGDAR